MKRYLFIFLALITIGCSDDEQLNTTSTNSIDVYAAGTINGNACYWKNGINFMLNNNGFSTTNAEKIMVTNGNTYVLGSASPQNANSNSPIPGAILFWENGAVVNLATRFNEPDYELIQIFDFFVDNNDVYISGLLRNVTNPSLFDFVYWKNGSKTVVKSNSSSFINSSIKVINNDVFLSYVPGRASGARGVYINSTFTPYSFYSSSDLLINDNNVFLYGDINPTTGFYYNANTSVQRTTPYRIHQMDFDQNNAYTLSIDAGNDFLRNILKDGLPFYQAASGFRIDEFEIYNDILYLVERDSSGTQTLYGGNSPIFSTNNSNSGSTGSFSFIYNIFIYQN